MAYKRPQQSKGLFAQLEDIGNSIGKEIDRAGRDAQQWFDGQKTSPLLNSFSTGNIVTLIARSTGRCLQILQELNGTLVVDALGIDSPQSFNVHWTVINLGNNIVRLHNNNNYLVIANGVTCLINFPPGSDPGVESQLRVSVRDNAFTVFESVKTPGHHLGVTPDGNLKPAVATSKMQMDSHFSCRVVYSPYPQPAPGKR